MQWHCQRGTCAVSVLFLTLSRGFLSQVTNRRLKYNRSATRIHHYCFVFLLFSRLRFYLGGIQSLQTLCLRTNCSWPCVPQPEPATCLHTCCPLASSAIPAIPPHVVLNLHFFCSRIALHSTFCLPIWETVTTFGGPSLPTHYFTHFVP